MKKLILCLSALALATGCTKFSGEWVQDATIAPDGKLVEVQSNRRALRFDDPATVTSGQYLQSSGVVSHESVSINNFWTLKNGRVAQFGEMNAHIDADGYLIADTGGDTQIRFVRQKGPSVFPPRVRLPAF